MKKSMLTKRELEAIERQKTPLGQWVANLLDDSKPLTPAQKRAWKWMEEGDKERRERIAKEMGYK